MVQPVSEYEHRIIPCINNSSLPAPIGFAHFSPGDAREPIERKEEKKTIAGIQQPTRTNEGGSGAKRVPVRRKKMASYDLSSSNVLPRAQCQDRKDACFPAEKVNKLRRRHLQRC